MKRSREELETRALLKAHGATFVRYSRRGHEVWKLPTGPTLTIDRTGTNGDWRAWRNSLARLKRMLPSAPLPGLPPSAPTVAAPEPTPEPPSTQPRKEKKMPKGKPKAPRRYFTADEDRRLIDLYKQGSSHSSIAKAIGRQPASVTKRLQYLRDRGLLLPGNARQAVANVVPLGHQEEYGVLSLKLPNKRELTMPIDQRKAEELVLKLLTGDL